MRVHSFLVQGAGVAFASRLQNAFVQEVSKPIDGLVLMSLGADHPTLIDAVNKNIDAFKPQCPIYLTETYGIIGFDDTVGANIELMEKGRGTEYGFRGGSGGQGCLAIMYSGDDVTAGHTEMFPQDASALMVVADTEGEFLKVAASQQVPVHYGGVAKQAWAITIDDDKNPTTESIPYFWVASKSGSGEPIGISAFTGDASNATKDLLSKIPSNVVPTGDVGLFPCYTRGVNQYGEENVEVNQISQVMSNIPVPSRIYGMFAHGELGPIEYSGFVDTVEKIDCTKHSMTSILSMHTKDADGAAERDL